MGRAGGALLCPSSFGHAGWEGRHERGLTAVPPIGSGALAEIPSLPTLPASPSGLCGGRRGTALLGCLRQAPHWARLPLTAMFREEPAPAGPLLGLEPPTPPVEGPQGGRRFCPGEVNTWSSVMLLERCGQSPAHPQRARPPPLECRMDSLVLLVCLLLLQGGGARAQGCGYRPDFDAPHASLLGNARIVGGTKARAGKWPWVVSIQTSSYHFCGGSIVHPWWVLSAAHCFTDRREGIRVAAGSNYLGRNNVTRWVRKIHLHPLYNPKTYDNDLALLLLEKPIPHSWFHTALCLPDRTIVPDENMWESCFVAGWGLTKAGSDYGSLELLDIQVGLVDWTLCLRWLNSITRNMVCAGFEEGGRDACQGDSGGPLMCLPPSHSGHGSPRRWYQVGIVSWGRSCAAPRSPGVYTQVSNYHSWLEQTSAHDGRPFRVPQIPVSPSSEHEQHSDLWANVDSGGAPVAPPPALCSATLAVVLSGLR